MKSLFFVKLNIFIGVLLGFTNNLVAQDTLKPACEQSFYSYNYLLETPKYDTLNNQIILIDSMILNGIIGIPADITVSCPTSNCSFLGGSSDYILISGTPVAQTSGVLLLAGDYTYYYNVAGTATTLRDTTNFAYWEITPPLTANVIVVADANCGEADGAAALYAFGSYEPFNYVWSNGQTGTVAILLAAGIYTVEIENTIGCKLLRYVTIENQESGPAATLEVISPNCQNENGSIEILTQNGAIPPFSAIWNTGDTTLSLSSLSAGQYIVALTDGLGCTAIYAATLSPTEITLTLQIQAANAGQANGSAILQPTGGTPPYQFFLNQLPTNDTISGLSVGNYPIQVVDAIGCSLDTFLYIPYPTHLEAEKNSVVSIYPNPFSTSFKLSFSQPFPADSYIEIYNSIFQKIYLTSVSQNSSNLDYELDMTNFTEGIYWICLFSEGSYYVKQIIKSE